VPLARPAAPLAGGRAIRSKGRGANSDWRLRFFGSFDRGREPSTRTSALAKGYAARTIASQYRAGIFRSRYGAGYTHRDLRGGANLVRRWRMPVGLSGNGRASIADSGSARGRVARGLSSEELEMPRLGIQVGDPGMASIRVDRTRIVVRATRLGTAPLQHSLGPWVGDSMGGDLGCRRRSAGHCPGGRLGCPEDGISPLALGKSETAPSHFRPHHPCRTFVSERCSPQRNCGTIRPT